MKIIIQESRLEKFIFEYFYKLFNVAEINLRHPWEMDSDEHEEYEDQTRTVFYYGNEFNDDIVFYYYDKGYFTPESRMDENCPLIVVEDEYKNILDGYFGKNWHEPFKKWFKENFDMNIKTIDTE